MLWLLPNPSSTRSIISSIVQLGTRNRISLCSPVLNILIHRDLRDYNSDRCRMLGSLLSTGSPSLYKYALTSPLVTGDKWLGQELIHPVVGYVDGSRGHHTILMISDPLGTAIKDQLLAILWSQATKNTPEEGPLRLLRAGPPVTWEVVKELRKLTCLWPYLMDCKLLPQGDGKLFDLILPEESLLVSENALEIYNTGCFFSRHIYLL